MRHIEKHSTGVTFGIGHDGKLYILQKANNTILESYKGPFTQRDTVEIHTYENQRWNAVSGVMGLRKNGFTSIGK